MTQSDTQLTWLMTWYASQCNGNWEHAYGVTIETIDNPDWRITINLRDTAMENAQRPQQEYNKDSDHDWWFCRLVDGNFEGASSPQHLTRLIQVFRSWVEEP